MTSSPPDRTLHCYRHDQAYVGQCERCLTVSFPDGMAPGKPMKVERKLSVEQVHAELRNFARTARRPADSDDRERIFWLIDQLPKPDVVEDCILTARSELGHTLDGDKYITIAQRNFAKGVISRYLELRGLPADPDLEEK